MVSPINSSLPPDVLGNVVLNFDNFNDVDNCALVCKDWNTAINAETTCRRLKLHTWSFSQVPYMTKLQDIYEDLKVINPWNLYEPDFDAAIGPITKLPPIIQQTVYDSFAKALGIDSNSGRKKLFESLPPSANYEEKISIIKTKKESVVNITRELQLKPIGNALVKESSNAQTLTTFPSWNQVKAFIQFSRLPKEMQAEVYTVLQNLLTAQGLFNHTSGQAAFNDPKIPADLKGAAVNILINPEVRENSIKQ